jgi:hypothetical protein
MRVLIKVEFFCALDDVLCPQDAAERRERCHGDYRHAKSLLADSGFRESEYFDVFHVLMAQGGFCDCEILYNVAETSRLKSTYWEKREERHEHE